jgi:hypothetical protein
MGHMKDKWIEQMEPKPHEWERRWIPVGERLPQPDVDVLVHFAISGFEIGCIEGLSGGWLCARDVCRDEATHWMPLPEPPA